MHDLKLREATAQDSDLAYRIKKAAFREYVEKVWGWDEAEQRRLHAKRFVAGEFRMIQVSGTDVGIIAVARQPDCVDLKQLYILPEFQGRGIGRACMLGVMRDADARGLPIRLQLLKVNRRALDFYKSLGFKEIGETATHKQMERPVMTSPSE
jgi:ribosomal protein S18 acetylase RimI-like enzyme